MKKVLVVLPLVVMLSACGTFKYGGQVEIDTKPSFGGGGHGSEVKYPSWYTDKNTDGALYAVASEYSNDFQMAVDKATLSAKRELASNFSSHVSAMMKDFANELGEDGTVVRELDRTTKMMVNKVNLVGVQRTEFKVQHENKGYRAFVKLRYATDDTNRLLLSEIKRNRQLEAKVNSTKAFKELEREVNGTPLSPIPRVDTAKVTEGVDVRPVE
jgi:hypothetical protein